MSVGRIVRRGVVFCALGCVVFAAAAGFKGTVLARPAADAAPTRMDPTKVMGANACIDCHKPEIAAWKASRHAANFDKTLGSDKAKEFAAKVGVTPANITREGMCADCHGLRAEGTANHSITGVSCESCHGASGGADGWLNPHGSYGEKGLTREKETPGHKEMRHETVDKAGMVRPANLYAMAKNCLGCHTVPNEDLQTMTDHPKGSKDFELSSWVVGDVAHNLFLDPKKNAEAPSLWMDETKRKPEDRKRLLYVLGQMADLEVSLRYLEAASKDGAYSTAMADRADKATGKLKKILKAAPQLKPQLKPFLDAYDDLTAKPGNKDVLDFADKVAGAGLDVEKNHDGSMLNGLDALIPKMASGDRFAPTK